MNIVTKWKELKLEKPLVAYLIFVVCAGIIGTGAIMAIHPNALIIATRMNAFAAPYAVLMATSVGTGLILLAYSATWFVNEKKGNHEGPEIIDAEFEEVGEDE